MCIKVRIIYSVVLQQNRGYNTYCRIEKNHNNLQFLCNNKRGKGIKDKKD